ncbi:MAG: NAD-dependent epimerase/dehydratase family protein [Myxococcota bacterium]
MSTSADSSGSRVAVVGAGFLGAPLARALGPGTVVASRSGTWRDDAPPDGVTLHPMDITAETLAIDPLLRCDALHIAVAPGGADVDRRALYVEGVKRLLDAVAAHPWRRLVYVSSTSALPNADGWIFESDARRPQSERGAVQRDAEDLVLAYGRRRNIPTLVLRLGGLYGPGRDLGRVYRRRRDAPMAGSGKAPTNLIHVEDAVAASLAALAAPAHVGGVIHVVDDDHQTRRAMYDALAQARGIEPVAWEAAVGPEAPTGKRVSNLRLKLDLGVRLKHPTHG